MDLLTALLIAVPIGAAIGYFLRGGSDNDGGGDNFDRDDSDDDLDGGGDSDGD